MTVVVSNGPTTINTTNGFYRCESWNMNFIGGVRNVTSTTTPCHLAVTFANAGNIKGIGLGIGSISSNQNRGIRMNLAQNNGTFTVTIASPGVFTQVGHGLNDLDEVFLDTTGALPTGLTKKTVRYYVRNKTADTFNLSTTTTGSLVNTSGTQSGTHTLWVARVSQSYTYAEILPANVNVNDSAYVYTAVPFEFTNTYAVDTTANKWRFIFWQEGGTTGSYYFMVSDGVVSENFSHFAWCDNQVSFTDDDVLICKDRVTIDRSFSIKGILGTGNTVYPTAGLICRSLNKGVNDIANLVWENVPSSSYKLTINGGLVVGGFAGIQIGSETSPIPASVKAVIEFVDPSVGTDSSCIRTMVYSSTTRYCGKNSYVFYGEIPTHRYANLSSDAATGQNKITLTEDLSAIWQVGDEIAIGKQNTKSVNGSTVTYTISSFNGAEITLNTNIASYSRIAGATVINYSRPYGIEMKSTADNVRTHRIESVIPLHARFSGIKMRDVYISSLFYQPAQSYEDVSGTKPYYCDNLNRMTQNSICQMLAIAVISRLGGDVKRNICWRSNVVVGLGALYISALKSGTLTIEDNIMLSSYTGSVGTLGNNYKVEIKNNRWDNPYYSAISLYGRNPVVTGNIFWGGSTSQPAVYLQTLCLNPTFSNNTFDNCNRALGFVLNAIVLNGISRNDIFGQSVANTYEMYIGQGAFGNFTITDSVGAIKVDTTYISETVNGFKFGVQNDNGVVNVDKMYLTEGYYVRCGDGLADTTAHTAGMGKFSLRMQPLLEALKFEQYIPTGNIQNLTMTVSAWIKINSENYWSGEHVLPRLLVNYDGGTIAYAQASEDTDRQQIFVTFTPTTTTGEITITISAETDQSGSNGYVYLDDMNIAYPPGYALDLGGLDIRSGATPVTPSIATFPNLGGVLDELMSSHNIDGSFADGLRKINRGVQKASKIIPYSEEI